MLRSPRMPEPAPEVPGFDFVSRLSSGGMGDVLLARRRGAHGFQKLVAIKTIRKDRLRQPELRVMFLDEARLMARLDHPAIAQVYDFGEANNMLYMAMEYLSGLTFADLMRKRHIFLPPVVCARIMAQVCWALHAVHELKSPEGRLLKVVHRDISPENLMLTFSGNVKILDFGIALRRDREAPVTAVGVLKGKPTYMAPEQRQGNRVDRRADVFAASRVLYEFLNPKTKSSSKGKASVPPALQKIVSKGLAFKPDDRFQDARAMAMALEQIVRAEGGESLPAFVERTLQKDRERHDLLLATMTSGDEVKKGPFGAGEKKKRSPKLQGRRITLDAGVLDEESDVSDDTDTTIADHSEPPVAHRPQLLPLVTAVPSAWSDTKSAQRQAEHAKKARKRKALALTVSTTMVLSLGGVYFLVSQPKVPASVPLKSMDPGVPKSERIAANPSDEPKRTIPSSSVAHQVLQPTKAIQDKETAPEVQTGGTTEAARGDDRTLDSKPKRSARSEEVEPTKPRQRVHSTRKHEAKRPNSFSRERKRGSSKRASRSTPKFRLRKRKTTPRRKGTSPLESATRTSKGIVVDW